MMSDRRSMQLYHALHRSNHQRVRHMVLNDGVSVNLMFADGTTPLHITAEKGDVETLEFLLSLRASPDVKNRHGQTPLMLAVLSPDVVGTLIEHKCRVNLTDSQRRTALHLAAAQGVPQVVSRLLVGNAQVNSQDRWSRTPLHIALLNVSHSQPEIRKYIQVTQLLLRYKCNVNGHDIHRHTPLFLAVNCRSIEITELLILHGANLDTYSRHHLTPLMLATMKGFTEIAAILLKHNCRVNANNPEMNKTSFTMAVNKGHFDIAKLLVEAGCRYHKEKWLVDKQLPRKLDPDLEEWILELRNNVPSLKLTCRSFIRKLLGKKILTYVDVLNYPKPLKSYILMTDLLNSYSQE